MQTVRLFYVLSLLRRGVPEVRKKAQVNWKAFLSGTQRVMLNAYAIAGIVLLYRLIVDLDVFIEDSVEWHEAMYKVGVALVHAIHGGAT